MKNVWFIPARIGLILKILNKIKDRVAQGETERYEFRFYISQKPANITLFQNIFAPFWVFISNLMYSFDGLKITSNGVIANTKK